MKKLTRETFESKYTPEPNTGCWLSDGKSPYGPTKIAWKLFKCDHHKGFDIRHSCDTPSCVNPSHLSLGTRQQNVDDMLDKGRAWQQLRTHCPSGHSYEDHGFKGPQGWRYCNVCQRTKHLKRKRSLPLGKQ